MATYGFIEKPFIGAPLPKKTKPKYLFKCNFCGKTFKRSIGSNTFEVKCPKCHETDTEPISFKEV